MGKRQEGGRKGNELTSAERLEAMKRIAAIPKEERIAKARADRNAQKALKVKTAKQRPSN